MSNEITVKLQCCIDDICRILEEQNFVIFQKYLLNDTYLIPNNLDISNMKARDILGKAILIRDITSYIPEAKVVKQTYKNKKIDKNGNILEQYKVECQIDSAESGIEFFEAIGYKKLMRIRENDIEYKNGELKVSIKDVENGPNLIELEENEEYNSIEKLKQALDKLDIPYHKNNYFVKKAEIELEKILESGCYK